MTDAYAIANIYFMARGSQIVVLGCLIFSLMGCNGPEKSEPIWEQVKVSDIAPSQNGNRPSIQLLKTINFDVHIFEIPAENVSELDDLWWMLYTEPLRFNNYNAFSSNSFIVRFGQIQMWNKTLNLLVEAGGQKVATISLLLSDGQANELAITGLNNKQIVSYISTDGSKRKATIGPGTLALRIKAEKIPGSRGACKFTAYPAFTLPIGSPIPELAARTKLREFPFSSAAFSLTMGPGDLIILGPNEYTSDQTTLGGLFFNKPEGSLFFSETEHKLPERKAAVKIFLLVCTRIND